MSLSSAFSQIEFDVNTRSSKVDTVFDYHFGIGVKDTLIKGFESNIYGSVERDEGVFYYQYKTSLSNDFLKLSHLKDTEIEAQMTSLNVFYTIKKGKTKTALGVDFSYSDTILYGGYVGIKYKFISIETAFNTRIYKVEYLINPKWEVNEKLKIGIKIKGTFIEDKYRWQNGINLILNLK